MPKILHRRYLCPFCGLRWAHYTLRVVVPGVEACPFCGGRRSELNPR